MRENSRVVSNPAAPPEALARPDGERDNEVVPRFVILEHDHPHLHWDLLLEVGPVLRAWRLDEPPQARRLIPSEAIPDHRMMYLDYEGPVSAGRGTVRRWDAGQFQEESQEPDRVVLRLDGTRCRGRAVLSRSAEQGWSMWLEVE